MSNFLGNSGELPSIESIYEGLGIPITIIEETKALKAARQLGKSELNYIFYVKHLRELYAQSKKE